MKKSKNVKKKKHKRENAQTHEKNEKKEEGRDPKPEKVKTRGGGARRERGSKPRKSWCPERGVPGLWGPEGPTFRVFFPSPVANFVLSSLSGSLFHRSVAAVQSHGPPKVRVSASLGSLRARAEGGPPSQEMKKNRKLKNEKIKTSTFWKKQTHTQNEENKREKIKKINKKIKKIQCFFQSKKSKTDKK